MYNKDQKRVDLIEEIKGAKKSISILGATIFDLPWKELIEDGLGEKFFDKKNDFEIKILCESENLISQYAILSELNINNGGGYSRGNLNGVKSDVVKELKGGLINYAIEHKLQICGLEPPVDIKKKELNTIFSDRIRVEMIDKIVSLHLEKLLKKEITEALSLYFDNQFGDFLKTYPARNSMHLFETAGKFQNEIKVLKEKIVDLIISDTFNINDFKKLDLQMMLKECKTSYCHYEKSEYVYEFENIKYCFARELGKPINGVIESFDGKGSENPEDGRKLSATKEMAEKLAAEEVELKKQFYNQQWETKQRLFIKNCYWPMPIAMIEIDGSLFITQALTRFDSIEKFQYVGRVDEKEDSLDEGEYKESYWINEFREYYNRYFIDDNGAQKYSTEETTKGDRKEVIDMFDEKRVRIGVGPRDAFLSNPSIIKTVVWALIFDRKGRMLIHRRAMNAKDNRGLWDKSVGGHVSIDDLDTIEAIRREISEELYTEEAEGQGGHDEAKMSYIGMEYVIYMGEWKTSRYPNISDLKLAPKESYLFSLNYDKDVTIKNFRREAITTTRLLPGGKSVDAKCFVDPYLCIVPEGFDMNNLKNSDFALLSPNELKHCVNTGYIKLNEKKLYDADAKDETKQIFKVTSDLKFLVNSSLWADVVTEFSRRIIESFKDK